MPLLKLPIARGKLAPYQTKPAREFPLPKLPFNRIAYAAAHVVTTGVGAAWRASRARSTSSPSASRYAVLVNAYAITETAPARSAAASSSDGGRR